MSFPISSASPLRMLPFYLSCPAQAGHPVITDASIMHGDVTPLYRRLLDHPPEFTIGPATSGRTRWRMMTVHCASPLLRRLMGEILHLRVDELQRRRGFFQHAPALEPVVGALHLVGRDRRRIADHEPALAQILDLERRDFRI